MTIKSNKKPLNFDLSTSQKLAEHMIKCIATGVIPFGDDVSYKYTGIYYRDSMRDQTFDEYHKIFNRSLSEIVSDLAKDIDAKESEFVKLFKIEDECDEAFCEESDEIINDILPSIVGCMDLDDISYFSRILTEYYRTKK